nr:EOG090X0FQ8 [Eurycercus lamellatus]
MSELERNPEISASSGSENIPQSIRDELVSTAVKFLQNPRVSARPNSEKELFLQRKGLSSAEIAAAFEASGINRISDNTVGHYSSLKVAQVHEYSNSSVPPPRSRWVIVKDVLNVAALIAGAAYSLHYFYRRFIAPFLFGRKKEKTLKESVEEMNNNLTRLVGEVSAAVQSLSATVATLRNNQREKSDIKELKSEVASLKALLLGRRQFPAPPTIVTGPPSIPSWQMGAPGSDKMDTRPSLSSSPEIISVDDIPANTMPITADSNSGLSARDPSESSESNSAEMIEMGASGSGGSGEDDTD